jgi:hypothetical protein
MPDDQEPQMLSEISSYTECIPYDTTSAALRHTRRVVHECIEIVSKNFVLQSARKLSLSFSIDLS